MESNQSQTLESSIAMAAEFPESDKARSPSLPSRPGPRLPLPPPLTAWSHARSVLGRVNHCKKQRDERLSNWRALGGLLPGLEEGGALRPSFPLQARTLLPLSRVGATPHHPQATPPTQSGASRRARGGWQRGTGHLSPTCNHNPTAQKHKALGFFTVSKEMFETWVEGKSLTLSNNNKPPAD